MAKTPEPPRSAEQLKEVAIFLKQADKLVREGDFAAALEEIARARARDPRNLYALAYEERVRSLMNATREKGVARAGEPPPPPEVIPPALEHISNLAIVEAQRSAAVAAKQEQELELRAREEDERKRQEELRRQAIESKIHAFLTRAGDYESRGDFNRALDEIARAYLLDPANDQIHAYEERIRKSQEEYKIREEQERIRRQQEEERSRQELMKAQMARLQREKEEKRKKEEEARHHAQQVKIQQYLKRANELFAAGKLDEAVSELAFVVVIDPLNEEVLDLDRKIREAQEDEQQQQFDLLRKRDEEQRKKKEAIEQAIRKHIENADKLAQQEKFSEALRVITRAYVLDPVNEELIEFERRIQRMQEDSLRLSEQRRREAEEQTRRRHDEELRRLEQAEHDRQVLGETAETEAKRRADKEKILNYLTKARKLYSESRLEDALGEVALAFIINPFDDDVKRMEADILRAQDDRKVQAAENVPEPAVDAGDSIAEKISVHLSDAAQLAADKEYTRALDEVAKAFMLDPLNERIQAYEEQLQNEFHEYQAVQQKRQEEAHRRTTIQTHIDRARAFLERAAFDEALAEVASGLTHDPDHAELRGLEEKIQNSFFEWQERKAEEERLTEIDSHVIAAKQSLADGKFEAALIELTKALVMEPERQDLRALEAEIEQARQDSDDIHRKDALDKDTNRHIQLAKEWMVHGSYEEAMQELVTALKLDPTHEGAIKLREKAHTAMEERSRRVADNSRRESLRNHIQRARKFLADRVFDEAIGEIALGLTIDPDNQELRDLEDELLKAQTESERLPENAIPAPEGELSQEEKDRLVHIHLTAADELQKNKDFARSLDEVAKAFVIDPLNREVKKMENRIRQNEIRHAQQTGQTLKLIYPNEKSAGGTQ